MYCRSDRYFRQRMSTGVCVGGARGCVCVGGAELEQPRDARKYKLKPRRFSAICRLATDWSTAGDSSQQYRAQIQDNQQPHASPLPGGYTKHCCCIARNALSTYLITVNTQDHHTASPPAPLLPSSRLWRSRNSKAVAGCCLLHPEKCARREENISARGTTIPKEVKTMVEQHPVA